jgi:hypothetical protein
MGCSDRSRLGHVYLSSTGLWGYLLKLKWGGRGIEMSFTNINEVNESELDTNSSLKGGQEASRFSTNSTLSLPPAPASTTPADVLSFNPPVPTSSNGALSVKAWRLVAREQTHLEPGCSSALYLKALDLFESEFTKIVSRLTQSLASEIAGIGQRLESCALKSSHGDASASLNDLKAARNLLSRHAELTSSLRRVVEWVKPEGIIDELTVSSSRDTCKSMRFLFLRNGNETVATIVLDNRAGRWVVGDIFFFPGTEISKEFALLKLHTTTPHADNVLSRRSPTR